MFNNSILKSKTIDLENTSSFSFTPTAHTFDRTIIKGNTELRWQPSKQPGTLPIYLDEKVCPLHFCEIWLYVQQYVHNSVVITYNCWCSIAPLVEVCVLISSIKS